VGKPINKQANSPFHTFINKILDEKKTRIIKQDIDSALVYVPKMEITCIFEIKRSTYDFTTWKPFPDDYPNYCALFKFKEEAGIDYCFVLYYIKNRLFKDGILKFQVMGIDDHRKPKFSPGEAYKLNDFEERFLKELYKLKTKIRETNLQGSKNHYDIYFYLNLLTRFQNHIYIGEENNWVMLISSSYDFKPLCLYREITGDLPVSGYKFDQDFTDILFERVSQRISIPYFRFYYEKNNLNSFSVKEFEELQVLGQTDFVDFYLNKIRGIR